jgi:hypothetical protein
LHDLTRLAVAALRHLVFDPGLLHSVRVGGAQAFDGGDLCIGSHVFDLHLA